ncbi:MAG TPA: pyridoxamine 5'-phosphate oxidase family protein [Solirubrobacterales bacterium]|nr:pyridoxamine 5'-phosphate oxidase family protein [Solirubrobacterales bacterium]
MASWSEIEAEAPELVARAREYFAAHTHHTLATVRRDGAPRISGTEVDFRNGEVYLGSMWKAVKALDLRRDPRFAVHCGTADPPEWTGDAKFAGRVEEIMESDRVREVNEGGPGRSHLFRCDITELVVIGLNEERTKMVIESWHEGRGVERMER